MTKQRFDEHSTQFGLWLRQQKEIGSELGFVATNLDYIWENYKTGKWMLIEEKRFMADLSYCQIKQFAKLNEAIKDTDFKGFHLLQFEKTSPDDGKIYFDYKEITKEQLINILKFN